MSRIERTTERGAGQNASPFRGPGHARVVSCLESLHLVGGRALALGPHRTFAGAGHAGAWATGEDHQLAALRHVGLEPGSTRVRHWPT